MNARIVPLKITIGILMDAVAKSKFEVLLIDGFPRNMENLQGFLSNETVKNTVKIQGVLYLSCSEKVCTERVLKRAKSQGDSPSSRKDDNLSILRKRFKSFEVDTKEVLSEFEKRRIKVFEIDSSGVVESVFERIVGMKCLDN